MGSSRPGLERSRAGGTEFFQRRQIKAKQGVTLIDFGGKSESRGRCRRIARAKNRQTKLVEGLIHPLPAVLFNDGVQASLAIGDVETVFHDALVDTQAILSTEISTK